MRKLEEEEEEEEEKGIGGEGRRGGEGDGRRGEGGGKRRRGEYTKITQYFITICLHFMHRPHAMFTELSMNHIPNTAACEIAYLIQSLKYLQDHYWKEEMVKFCLKCHCSHYCSLCYFVSRSTLFLSVCLSVCLFLSLYLSLSPPPLPPPPQAVFERLV